MGFGVSLKVFLHIASLLGVSEILFLHNSLLGYLNGSYNASLHVQIIDVFSHFYLGSVFKFLWSYLVNVDDSNQIKQYWIYTIQKSILQN